MNELTSRYAEGLYLLKKEKNQLEETQEVVREIIKIINDNPTFISLISNRDISNQERLEIIDKVFKSVDEDIVNFFKIIIENNRGRYLLEILKDFNSLVNEFRGVKEGLLYSAFPLKDEEIQKITSSISEIEKCPIELKNIIDPSLIGGVKVAINDKIYDGSLKHHIEQMKLTLLKKEGE